MPNLDFYLVPTNSYYSFRFCDRHAYRYEESMQNYAKFH